MHASRIVWLLTGAALACASLAIAQPVQTIPRPQTPPPRQVITPTRPPLHLREQSVTIDATELSFVGGDALAAEGARGPAITVTAPELNFVGGEVRAAEVRGDPVTVNVPELNFVGQ